MKLYYLDIDNKYIGRFKYTPDGAHEFIYDGTQHFYDGDEYIGGYGDGAEPPIGSTRKDSAPIYVPSARELRREAIKTALDDDDFKDLIIALAYANPAAIPTSLRDKVEAARDA